MHLARDKLEPASAIEEWIHPIRRFTLRGHGGARCDKDDSEDERSSSTNISPAMRPD